MNSTNTTSGSSEVTMPSGVNELNSTTDTNKDQLNNIAEKESQRKEKGNHVEGAGKSWVGLFAGSKLAAQGMNPSSVESVIIDGEHFAQLRKEISQETLKWEKTTILYVVGDYPTIGALESFIPATWNFTSKPNIYYHNEYYFVVLFNSLEDRDTIIFYGPYTINSIPIIVRAWSPEFNLSEEVGAFPFGLDCQIYL